MSRWRWAVRILTRRIWFRAALFCALGVVLALAATALSPLVPPHLDTKIGSDAVDNILEILASSMLAVVTFSMSAMVSAYSGAASTITPRATRLLIEDATAQNALSSFMGAFLFAVVGLCALSTRAYGPNGRVILFVGTIAVIAFIVFTMLRWIEHLSRFGRMLETIQRVEKAACRAARTLAHRPHLGAAPEVAISPSAEPVAALGIGYVTHVDIPMLNRLAALQGLVVHVLAHPGTFVAPGRPVARVEGREPPLRAIASAFTLDQSREYDQDPRFGLVVLGEIASRALSPAVNDPGSAIAVVGAGLRVFDALLTTERTSDTAVCGPVHMPALSLADMLEDLFRPIGRDGAGLIEVDLQVQKALGALKVLAPDAAALFRHRADDALARAEAALSSEADRTELRATYAVHWPPDGDTTARLMVNRALTPAP